jgi:hypothetical protein
MRQGAVFSLFAAVQSAQHRDCSRLPYHELLQRYVSSLKALPARGTNDAAENRRRFDIAVNDCLLSSIFASRWVDVALPQSLEALPDVSSVPSMYDLFLKATARVPLPAAEVVTSSFLASDEGGASITAALSNLRKSCAAGVGHSEAAVRPVVLVPFSTMHDAKRQAALLDGRAPNSRLKAATVSAINAVMLMLRQQSELLPEQKISPSQIDLCVVPPSVEFSLIVSSAMLNAESESLWTTERIAGDVNVRTAFLVKALRCRGVVGMHTCKTEKNTFLSLGIHHGRWPLWNLSGDDAGRIHRSAQHECSRLAFRFQQRETNIRQGYRS